MLSSASGDVPNAVAASAGNAPNSSGLSPNSSIATLRLLRLNAAAARTAPPRRCEAGGGGTTAIGPALARHSRPNE